MLEQLSVRQRVELKQLIDQELDCLYEQASKLGRLMGTFFGTTSRSQLRNLEAVVGAATRTSALKNHIKNQTGKDRDESWSQKTDGKSLGAQTLELVEQLSSRAATVTQKLRLAGSTDELTDVVRFVEIELQRGVVQTAVCAALYADLGAQP